MIARRPWLAAGLAVCAGPLCAQGSSRRLGWLRLTAGGANELQTQRIPTALAQLGWIEGRNLVIERRFAAGQLERLPELARDLVQRRCDAILTVGLSAARAVRDGTAAIPVVMFGNFDPVAAGLVASLARPGGNLTGVLIAPDGTLAAKRMELLKQAVPRATSVAFLLPDDPGAAAQVAEARKAAASLGIELELIRLRADFDNAALTEAFAAMTAKRVQALFVGSHTLLFAARQPIIELALEHRLPTTWEWIEQVRDGGLMAYSTSLTTLYDRLAGYVDRIFKGARPGELPIERPSTFGLAVNLRTARAIGLALPRELVLRAEEVIE